MNEDNDQEIEIEYKEFPKSEFLEIRKKPKSGTESSAVPGQEDRKKTKMPQDNASLESVTGEQSRSVRQGADGAGHSTKKKCLLIFFAGLLTAGILAGIYYLLKLLF